LIFENEAVNFIFIVLQGIESKNKIFIEDPLEKQNYDKNPSSFFRHT